MCRLDNSLKITPIFEFRNIQKLNAYLLPNFKNYILIRVCTQSDNSVSVQNFALVLIAADSVCNNHLWIVKSHLYNIFPSLLILVTLTVTIFKIITFLSWFWWVLENASITAPIPCEEGRANDKRRWMVRD